ncbi:MAG: MFS transporter [Syntrophobacteraceae bacterium]
MEPIDRPVPAASKDLGSQILPLLILAGVFFFSFTSRIILAPMLLTIETDLQLGHAEAGALFTYISAGVFVGLLGSGWLSTWWNYRRTVFVSAVFIGAAATAVSLSVSPFWLRANLCLLGFGAGLYFPSGIASITSLVRRQDWGKALAIHELAPNMGFVLAPLLAEFLMRFLMWRHIVLGLGVMSSIAALLYLWVGRGGGDVRGEYPGLANLNEILRKGSFWIMALLFMLSVGGSLGVYTMAPLFLVTERGFEREAANQLVALSRIPGVVMALVAGWVVDRLGIKRSIGCFCALTGLSTLMMGLNLGSLTPLVVTLQAILSVCFFPAGYAALARVVRLSQGAMTVAFCSSMAILAGAGILPSVLGFLAERGSFPVGFVAFGAAMMAAACLVPFVRFSPESVEQDRSASGNSLKHTQEF